jgi:hypothetical protein
MKKGCQNAYNDKTLSLDCFSRFPGCLRNSSASLADPHQYANFHANSNQPTDGDACANRYTNQHT